MYWLRVGDNIWNVLNMEWKWLWTNANALQQFGNNSHIKKHTSNSIFHKNVFLPSARIHSVVLHSPIFRMPIHAWLLVRKVGRGTPAIVKMNRHRMIKNCKAIFIFPCDWAFVFLLPHIPLYCMIFACFISNRHKCRYSQ